MLLSFQVGGILADGSNTDHRLRAKFKNCFQNNYVTIWKKNQGIVSKMVIYFLIGYWWVINAGSHRCADNNPTSSVLSTPQSILVLTSNFAKIEENGGQLKKLGTYIAGQLRYCCSDPNNCWYHPCYRSRYLLPFEYSLVISIYSLGHRHQNWSVYHECDTFIV